MKFIPLLAFNDYIEAHILLGRLQNEGINCWLQNENMVTVFPALTNAVGGIKLMVEESQEEKATELLRQFSDILPGNG
jgi:metallophosphoesterase superfamily enzyme